MRLTEMLQEYSKERAKSYKLNNVNAFWDSIQSNVRIYNLFTQYEIDYITNMCLNPKYNNSDGIDYKQDQINKMMEAKGFYKSYGGTSRRAYFSDQYPDIVVKISFEKRAMRASASEVAYQNLLKPYIAKIFDCTPEANILIMERVTPILKLEQFLLYANRIYNILSMLSKKYLFSDIGADAFKNWGIRPGFGGVMLDYSNFFEKPSSMICNGMKFDLFGGDNTRCTGTLSFDVGFNRLKCDKCGRDFIVDVDFAPLLFNTDHVKKVEESRMYTEELNLNVDFNVEIVNVPNKFTRTDTVRKKRRFSEPPTSDPLNGATVSIVSVNDKSNITKEQSERDAKLNKEKIEFINNKNSIKNKPLVHDSDYLKHVADIHRDMDNKTMEQVKNYVIETDKLKFKESGESAINDFNVSIVSSNDNNIISSDLHTDISDDIPDVSVTVSNDDNHVTEDTNSVIIEEKVFIGDNVVTEVEVVDSSDEMNNISYEKNELVVEKETIKTESEEIVIDEVSDKEILINKNKNFDHLMSIPPRSRKDLL